MKHALRQLRRTPGFAALAVLTLALGIAANLTIFAIVDELTFKPLRGTNLEDVFSVSVQDPKTGQMRFLQVPDFETLSAAAPSGVVAIASHPPYPEMGLLQAPGRARRARVLRISGHFDRVYRIRPAAGRWIEPQDNTTAGGADVAVISHRLWREWFDTSPDAVTRGSILLDKKPRQVIGVAPPGLSTNGAEIWVPMGPPVMLSPEELQRRGLKVQPGIGVMMRTDPGVPTPVVAGRLTAAIASRVATPESPTGIVQLRQAQGEDRLGGTGYTILGFATLIFLAACANLGNLLMARATDREGELAVRLSLGATRFGVFRTLMTEAAVICAGAAALGFSLTVAALRVFTRAFPSLQVSFRERVTLELSPDWRLFTLAAGAGVLAAGFVGAASLWRASRVSLSTRLAASGPAVVARTEGRTLRTLLVSVQISAAVILLIACGVFLEHASVRMDHRLLFDTSGLTAARMYLPATYDESRARHFFDAVVARAGAIEGVTHAAVADAVPGGLEPPPMSKDSSLQPEAPERGVSGIRRLNASWVHASPRFFETIGLRLIRGRDFEATDTAGSLPVAIVSESAAAGLWPGEDPLGKRLYCCRASTLRLVVGVAADPVRSNDTSPETGPGTYVFLPAAQHDERGMFVIVRSSDPKGPMDALRQAIIEQDDSVSVYDVAPVDVSQFSRVASERGARAMATALGATALTIAVLGVYAVVSYFVTRRRREFGLRLALGATRGQVVKLVIDHAIHMVLIGLVPGVLLASWGTHVFVEELVRLRSSSLAPWIAGPLIMLAAGIIAAYIPARRAAKVEPIRTLKEL